MIIEADAKFPLDWKGRLEETMGDLPEQWDIFLIGNSHTKDKPGQKICGDVWEVSYPFCTHAYLVRKKALNCLLTHARDATTNIDITLINKVLSLIHI